MSQENVEMLRRATDAFNRGDLDAWFAEFDPEIVWYPFPDEPEPGPFRGLEAVQKMVARWMELFSGSFRSEVEEYIDAGEYVLVPTRMRGHIAGSTTDVVVDEVYVNKCRDGKIIEVRECRTREEALEAASPSE
jgi:ketosteroid isomerase-like protein